MSLRAAYAMLAVGLSLSFLPSRTIAAEPQDALTNEARTAMRRAASYFHDRVAVHGGYVYYCSLDLEQRWGEGKAAPSEVWVQPPGTPAVGMAYLAAYRATGDRLYLDAARDAAGALLYGQIKSGGWTSSIDFDPNGKRTAQYRRGNGRGRNNSTLDDNTTQSALRFLMHLDETLEFRDEEVHEAAQYAFEALLKAQYPVGAFPQVWTGPVPAEPAVKASFPDYDWRTEHRVKEYWNFYTLNDDLCGDVADVLLDGLKIYKDQRCAAALAKLGDFLLLAQMPEPQPAWAQQYDFAMHPVWARKFEPPAITGHESQDAIETLMKVYRQTSDAKYLEPIPRALAYLKSSLLSDGRLARFYELRTNKPLYMTRNYELTFDDNDVPTHYGFKVGSRLDRLERQYADLRADQDRSATNSGASLARRPSAARVREILAGLDDQGRWISGKTGERLVGQPKFSPQEQFISSAVFCRNLETLSAFVASEQP
jgi:PelA/Pel-15E family pectate lyase